MSFSLRTTILATGCILAIGTSAARAQMPRVFYYYPAPGNYATTQGIVNIPAADYYYNVPLNGALASARTAPAKEFPYSNFPFYYVHYSRGGASTDAGVGENYESNERRSEYGSGDDEDDPDW